MENVSKDKFDIGLEMFKGGSGRFKRGLGDRKKPMKMPKIFKIDEKGLKRGLCPKWKPSPFRSVKKKYFHGENIIRILCPHGHFVIDGHYVLMGNLSLMGIMSSWAICHGAISPMGILSEGILSSWGIMSSWALCYTIFLSDLHTVG